MCNLLYVSCTLPRSVSGKEPTSHFRRCKRLGFNPSVRKIPWRRAWQLTPVFMPGDSHGQRNLVGYSPRGHKESDTTEQLTLLYVSYTLIVCWRDLFCSVLFCFVLQCFVLGSKQAPHIVFGCLVWNNSRLRIIQNTAPLPGFQQITSKLLEHSAC